MLIFDFDNPVFIIKSKEAGIVFICDLVLNGVIKQHIQHRFDGRLYGSRNGLFCVTLNDAAFLNCGYQMTDSHSSGGI